MKRRTVLMGGVALAATRAWARPALAARLDRVAFFDAGSDGERVVAVGERGVVFVSEDRGDHWRQAENTIEADLAAVHLDGDRGWAVGHRGTVLRSDDGGRHWQAAKVDLPEANALFDVVIDGSDGWAVGAFGVIARSRDGGATWQGERPLGEDFDKHLYGIGRTAAGGLFVVGENGTLLTSSDRGATWRQLESPYIGSFFGIAVLDGDRLLVHGMRGHAYRSDDAGRSWTRITGVPEGLSLQGARRIAPGRVTLAGLDGAVFLSRDNGATFSMLPPQDRRAVRVALAGRDERLLVFGEGGFYRAPPSK